MGRVDPLAAASSTGPNTTMPEKPGQDAGPDRSPASPTSTLLIAGARIAAPAGPDSGASSPRGKTPGIDEFEIIGPISEGGMSHVYRARQVRLAREVALKVLRADLAEDPTYRKRFQAEAKAAARISHPGVVRVWGAGEWKDLLWIAYELVEGETLADVLAREPVLEPPRACLILARVAEAVAAAHRHGVIHRDLKPNNILLAPDGRPLVTDFGLAKRLPMGGEHSVSGTPLSRTGEVFGTPAYMAPEQVRGKIKEHGPAADIWALGVILYRMLSGTLPFDGENAMQIFNAIILQPPVPLSRVRSSLPPVFDRLLPCLLEKEPAMRLDRANLFAETLHRLGTALAAGEPCDDLLAPIETYVAGKGRRSLPWRPARSSTGSTEAMETTPAAGPDPGMKRLGARPIAVVAVLIGLAGVLAWFLWWYLWSG